MPTTTADSARRDPWDLTRRQPEYARLKVAYDLAEGDLVERTWQAAQALELSFIDAMHMMGVFRGPTGTNPVTPVPANFDPVRDTETMRQRSCYAVNFDPVRDAEQVCRPS